MARSRFATTAFFLLAASASCQNTCLGDARSTKDVSVKELRTPRFMLSSAGERLHIEIGTGNP